MEHDDDMPTRAELAAEEWEDFDSLGHDWQEAGDLRRDWDDWQFAGRFAECNNCGQITRDPREVTERCPA